MKISKHKVGDITVFKVDGDIDCFTVSQLKDGLLTQLKEGACNIIVDLADVTYLDSSAIGLLVNTHNDLVKVGYSMGLVHVNKETMQLLKLTFVDQIMEIYSSYNDFKKK